MPSPTAPSSPDAPTRLDPVWVETLHKQFDDTVALDGVTVSVRESELFGFIGPDGAGKTTLFRILTGLLVPDDGRASVLGFDPVDAYRDIRRRVGYMPGRFSLYADLSVSENLNFFASVFGTRPEEQMDLIGPVYSQIEPFRDRAAGDLSGGMKQKLALSCALVHRPEVLLLDEPTTGVDAVSRREFWDLLTDLKAQGLTILVSTPYMDEASRCDRVALLDEGTILDVDTPAAISAAYERPLLAVQSDDRYRLLTTLREHPHAASVFPFGDSVHFTDARRDAAPDAFAADLATWLRERDFEDVHVAPVDASIEDAFMALMSADR